MSVYVNHRGYLPSSVKMCLVGGRYDDDFEIINAERKGVTNGCQRI
jgi:hypothetical protein